MNAAGVAEVIREALGSRGQLSSVKVTGDREAQFELTTTEEMARVFEIRVGERS